MTWRRERPKRATRKKSGASARRPSARIEPALRSHFYTSICQANTRLVLVSVSTETDDALHPALIDCNIESIWPFDTALGRIAW